MVLDLEGDRGRRWYIAITACAVLAVIMSAGQVAGQCCSDFYISVHESETILDTGPNSSEIAYNSITMQSIMNQNITIRLWAEVEDYQIGLNNTSVTIPPGGIITIPFWVSTLVQGISPNRICTMRAEYISIGGVIFTGWFEEYSRFSISGSLKPPPAFLVKAPIASFKYGDSFELGMDIRDPWGQSGNVLIEIVNDEELRSRGIRFNEHSMLRKYSPDRSYFSFNGEDTGLQGRERYDVVELRITQQENPNIVYHQTVILHRERRNIDPSEGILASMVLLIPLVSFLKMGPPRK
jgi:hypothetical protein